MKVNEHTIPIKFEIGDFVRVWAIFGRPRGEVRDILDVDTGEPKCLVVYTYMDGTIYKEVFAMRDLTLIERKQTNYW